jgi:hypothetical protein
MPTQSGGLFNGLSTPWSDYGYEYGYSNGSQGGVGSGVLQYVFYFFTLTVIVLLVLTLVHFTIRPIFKTSDTSKGVIPLPGFTTPVPVFWQTENTIQPIAENQTPVSTRTENYSYILDIQLDNPTAQTQNPRVLFVRGPPMTAPSASASVDANSTIRSIVPNFNTIVYLNRLTNDLNVSLQCAEQRSGLDPVISEANILIENIPIRKPIRLGVMVGSRVLEVYVNGYLARSKTFTVPIRAVQGNWQPPVSAIREQCARVGNLRIFDRPLSPAEFRALGTPPETTFSAFAIPDSIGSCPAGNTSTN